MQGSVVVGVSFAYLGLLFAIAYYAEKRAGQGRSLTNNPYIYTLSIAVYCTSWTFYGSVGKAAKSGLDFLPIYLGPTLVFVVWALVLAKIIRICKVHRITSIADFISSRYGKNFALGSLVTVIAVIGTTPYISLQLKSIATSFNLIVGFQNPNFATYGNPFGIDTTLVVAVALALFAILFGTRHIESSEHHEGLIAAIAFESLVKLFAFLSVGFFVTFSVYDGFADLFFKAQAHGLSHLFVVSDDQGYGQWMTMTILSMAAILFLPRQFYITAVENRAEAQLRTAAWLFPLYLLVINIFVLPIAISGKLAFTGTASDADMFVLSVPMHFGQGQLALFAFIGGLSAATSMVIVASIALSTMVCNNLVMPLLLRWEWVNVKERGDLSALLLGIRRTSILIILLLGYGYFRIASESYSLVTIGLVSFTAVAQFAPPIIGGIFWKGGSSKGALTGLSLGFLVWLYTLLLPSFAQSGWLPIHFISDGLFGLGFLKPYALFGLEGFDNLSHTLFWSMLANIGGYVFVSLWGKLSPIDRIQGGLFVDMFANSQGQKDSRYWQGTATVTAVQDLVGRFVGTQRAENDFQAFARARNISLNGDDIADNKLLTHAENRLSGAIGSATARVIIGSMIKGENVSFNEVFQILDETTQVIEYSRMLEIKSTELEETSIKLQRANKRLKEFDSLKDDFLSTISHELRTPLTSIRAFSEILFDEGDTTFDERQQFLGIITKESERLTRLIDQILDLAKMEAGRMDWVMSNVDPASAMKEALATMDGLIKESNIELLIDISKNIPPIQADRDQLVQVVINVVSNAIKFCKVPGGVIRVTARRQPNGLLVNISDNGEGILPEHRDFIFEKFHQIQQGSNEMPIGTGLGLAICRQIITFFGGDIWADSAEDGGARISFNIPFAQPSS
jgi:Na+/proline symporter/nitrogen-specific signal transduction histidine kinase